MARRTRDADTYSFNYAAVSAAVAASQSNGTNGTASYMPSPNENEDCLFLDVVVPKKIFDNAHSMRRRQMGASGAPVLVW